MAVAVPTMAHSSIPTSLPALLQQVADKHIVLAIADVDGEMSPGSRCEPQFSTRQWVAPSCTHPGLTKAHLPRISSLTLATVSGPQSAAGKQPQPTPLQTDICPLPLLTDKGGLLILAAGVILIENCCRRGSLGWSVIQKLPMREVRGC